MIAVFALADSRAEDAFFVHYAKENGFALGGQSFLPEATPLLRKGDSRYAERTLTGDLAPGVNGILALYTYEEETTDSEGNRETDYYRYTVGLVQIPECAELIPELYVQRKFGLKALEKLEDAFRGDKERVKFESAELDKRFEIFVDEKQDQNWLRQLFSPSFIVWLLQKTPDKFAFELANGTLCCYANNHKEKAADLDRMRAATPPWRRGCARRRSSTGSGRRRDQRPKTPAGTQYFSTAPSTTAPSAKVRTPWTASAPSEHCAAT